MKKIPTRLLLTCMILIAPVLILSGCTGPESTTPDEAVVTDTPNTNVQPERHNPDKDVVPTVTKTEPATVKINIKDSAFSPPALTIKKGTTIVWTNLDTASHQVRGDNFEGTTQSKGETWSYTFNEKGTFDYICSIHPYMKATITVE